MKHRAWRAGRHHARIACSSADPLLILWIGIGIEEKIGVIFIGGDFFQRSQGCSRMSRGRSLTELFNAAYTLGASKGQIVMRVLLLATLPGII